MADLKFKIPPTKTLEQEKQKLLKEKDEIVYRFEQQWIKDLDEQGKYKKGIRIKNYVDGSKYEGEVINEKRNGKGIYHYSNGDKYVGEWKDDRFHGRGVYIFANGERYDGELRESAKHGRGVYLYVNGNKYEGEWMNDKKNGKGSYTYFATNEKYDGQWLDGEKHGTGMYIYTSGDKYYGEWRDGEKCGKGVFEYQNGSRFEGEFLEDKANGFGVMQYSNEDRYEGEWTGGQKHGQGTYFYADGAKYQGEWRNENQNGHGIFYYVNGDRYEGTFVDGERCGKGIYYYLSGDKYEGEYRNDVRNGQGVLTLTDGDVFIGEWANGTKNGQGRYEYANGDYYEGFFQDGKRQGKGTYHWMKGQKYVGLWKNDRMEGEIESMVAIKQRFRSSEHYKQIIKDLLTGKKEMIDTELEFFIADRDTIDDFLYEIDSSFVRIECGKMFDSIDLIFFEGDANLRPWSPNAYKFLILLRMCMRSNKIIFASSFAMQGLVFLIASNIECQISIINGLNGSQLGDLSKIKKSMNEIRMSDYFLDNVTGDLYSFNYDTGEWVGKGNAGLHSRRAAEEFKTIGKYIVKAPQYKVQRMKEIDQLYVSKENEVVCSLRKNSMHNYLFYDLPFEFVVPFKNSWDVHPFNFVNPKKTFQTMADCEKGPLVICISDNIVATQFSIRTKYKETVQMLRNFMGYQLTKLCSGRAQTIPIEVASIKQNDNAMDIYLEQLSRSKYSNQKTIKFNVITEFHHAGFAAKKSNQLDVVVNNAIGKKKFKQTQQKLNPKDLDQLLLYNPSPQFSQNQQQEIDRKPSIYSAQPNHYEEKTQNFQKTNLEIIQILHPSIDAGIFTQNKPFWVPGYLSQCRLQKYQMSKKQNTTSEDGPSNTHILTDFKQNTTPRMPRTSSQPHFRVIQKDKWMTNKNFQV